MPPATGSDGPLLLLLRLLHCFRVCDIAQADAAPDPALLPMPSAALSDAEPLFRNPSARSLVKEQRRRRRQKFGLPSETQQLWTYVPDS